MSTYSVRIEATHGHGPVKELRARTLASAKRSAEKFVGSYQRSVYGSNFGGATLYGAGVYWQLGNFGGGHPAHWDGPYT